MTWEEINDLLDLGQVDMAIEEARKTLKSMRESGAQMQKLNEPAPRKALLRLQPILQKRNIWPAGPTREQLGHKPYMENTFHQEAEEFRQYLHDRFKK